MGKKYSVDFDGTGRYTGTIEKDENGIWDLNTLEENQIDTVVFDIHTIVENNVDSNYEVIWSRDNEEEWISSTADKCFKDTLARNIKRREIK